MSRLLCMHPRPKTVLAECKANPVLRLIPIIILTSTSAPKEITSAYARGAAAYCLKLRDLDEYLSLIRMSAEFWGRRAQLAV